MSLPHFIRIGRIVRVIVESAGLRHGIRLSLLFCLALDLGFALSTMGRGDSDVAVDSSALSKCSPSGSVLATGVDRLFPAPFTKASEACMLAPPFLMGAISLALRLPVWNRGLPNRMQDDSDLAGMAAAGKTRRATICAGRGEIG